MTTETNAAARKAWRVREAPATVPEGPWPAIIGRLLANRGVTDAAQARAFLDLEPAAAPAPLPDLDIAVERLARACRAGETVAVFGDFDVDGITAAAILTEHLESLGARPVPYLPHRVDEGYGLSKTAVESLAGLGATLLVTADCGTSSREEIAHADRLGVETIVLDHHTVPPVLPAATAVVNPRRIDGIADEPAACGIAYYVMRALRDALGAPADGDSMIELAAMGTVCDVAPLVDGNRTLVREGLRVIGRTERPGLRALLAVSGSDPARVSTETIGFTLGPRLNAAGRLAHARLAFDLLTTRDEDEAERLAAELDGLNRERQRATEDAVALAEELLAGEGDAPLLMVGHEDLSSGIVGLVAARLVEARRRPAVVYQRGETESRASARSIPEFHITDALRALPEGLFLRFGGHRMAAGFTALNEKLPSIKEALLEAASRELRGLDLTPTVDVDAECPLASIRGEEIRWLGRLAPHGAGNPEPAFLSRSVLVVERRNVGSDGAHLRLKLRDGRVTWPAIAFRNDGDGVEEGASVDVVYTLSADRFTSDGLQLRVIDLRPAAM